MLKSTLPLATASLISAFNGALMYWISVNPSARSSSSATNCGAWQSAGVCIKRTEVVSGGPSAATASGAPAMPAAPTRDNVVRK
jgi:hypothetical protein